MNSLLLTDFYKVSHPFQYPKGITHVYSNFTARKSRLPGVDKVVFVGITDFLDKVLRSFRTNFFFKTKDSVLWEYEKVCRDCVGDLPSYKHIEELYDLGYLPVQIKALPEGSIVPMGVPMITIVNTDPKFFWVTNFLETILSASIWKCITSATIALEYKKIFRSALIQTGENPDFADWMGHDSSFRGMSCLESAIQSGIGHLTSFKGTDTIPAILRIKDLWFDSYKEIGGSVPATEHSVMSSGTSVEGEFETYKRLITETYPNGIVSIVSDTYNLWNVLTKILPNLKKEILSRDGKVVIRPDSGNPLEIICGNPKGATPEERAGLFELLWYGFGGTTNSSGYKVLNPKIGAIYGDSITLDLAKRICDTLISKGFVPNMVFGIGSYTYNYNTRDTFGMAMKCTAVKKDGVWIPVWKDPITDDGTKKSLRGLLTVQDNQVYQEVSEKQEQTGDLKTVFVDGRNLLPYNSLYHIRRRIHDTTFSSV